MSEKRMFSKQITDSDAFLDMPLSTQALYFHLGMAADDDGFINAPKRIQRMVGGSDDDFKLLIAKNFIIPFESGVVVIKHWKINNYIRSDRYKETAYLEEKSMLSIKENGAYSMLGIPSGSDVVYADKNRLDKNKLSSGSKGKFDIIEELTLDEIHSLHELYENAAELIDEVEKDINRKKKGDKIDNIFGYVIGYATNKGWVEKHG